MVHGDQVFVAEHRRDSCQRNDSQYDPSPWRMMDMECGKLVPALHSSGEPYTGCVMDSRRTVGVQASACATERRSQLCNCREHKPHLGGARCPHSSMRQINR